MNGADELTDEERAIVAFLEVHFEQRGMRGALAMLKNAETRIDDLRVLIESYRAQYEKQRQ